LVRLCNCDNIIGKLADLWFFLMANLATIDKTSHDILCLFYSSMLQSHQCD
jgi:hypothetical protein